MLAIRGHLPGFAPLTPDLRLHSKPLETVLHIAHRRWFNRRM